MSKTMNTERYQMLVESVCKEHDCLRPTVQKDLGMLLEAYFEKGCTDYMMVVSFLYRTDEIDLETEHDLLDLA